MNKIYTFFMLEILDKNYNNALSAVSKFALPAAHLTCLV